MSKEQMTKRNGIKEIADKLKKQGIDAEVCQRLNKDMERGGMKV
ncbi:hypothetical protein [Evansella tamaricis]|nr:hypothetical protein [Evansella tamaricis]